MNQQGHTIEELGAILECCDKPRETFETDIHPGQIAFDALLSFLDTAPSQMLREALELTEKKLSSYPDFARREYAIGGTTQLLLKSQGWPIVRHLTYNSQYGPNDYHFLLAPEMASITGIAFQEGVVGGDVIRLLDKSSSLNNLGSLDLGLGLTDDARPAFQASAQLKRLRELRSANRADFFLTHSLGLESVHCSGTPDLIEVLEQRCVPHIRSLHLVLEEEGAAETVDALVSHPRLAGCLADLTITPLLDYSGLAAILRCPYFTNLRTLDVGGRHREADIAGIEECTYLPQLTELRLRLNEVGDEGWLRIAKSPLEKLHTLDLSSSQGTDTGATALGASSRLANLRRLYLAHNRIGPDGVTALTSSRWFSGLRSLDLGGNPLLSEGSCVLADSPNATKLQNLVLTNCGADGAVAIGQSPHLGNLENLCLSYREAGSIGAEALAGSRTLTKLLRLSIGVGLDDECAKVLSRSSVLGSLRRLSLTGKITSEGTKQLAASPHLNNMWELNLDLCPIGDVGAEAIARSRTFARLVVLRVTGCGLTEAGSRTLAESKSMSRLRYLGIEPELLLPWEASSVILPLLRERLKVAARGQLWIRPP
jgi:hypothetical protein